MWEFPEREIQKIKTILIYLIINGLGFLNPNMPNTLNFKDDVYIHSNINSITGVN